VIFYKYVTASLLLKIIKLYKVTEKNCGKTCTQKGTIMIFEYILKIFITHSISMV
jgi:hypothetical protein